MDKAIIDNFNCCCNHKNDKCNDISYIDSCCIEETGEMVNKLVRQFQLFEENRIKTFGYTFSQCYVLLEILKAEKLSMHGLSEKMNLDASTMTRIINNLVRDGLVKRERDDIDKRVIVVSLTNKGEESALELDKNITQYYIRIINNIPKGQVRNTLETVSILLTAFERANHIKD